MKSKSNIKFKVKLEYDRKNIIWVAVAVILAIIMYVTIGYHIAALLAYSVLYSLIKSIKIDLDERLPWLWTAILFAGGACLITFSIQYMLLEPENFSRTSDLNILLNVLCYLVFYLSSRFLRGTRD